MEFKVSIFDIFSYLFPGLIYFLSIVIIGDFFIQKELIPSLLNLPNFIIVLIIIFSYMLGHALQPLHKINFFKFFFKNTKKLENQLQPIINQIDSEVFEILEKQGYSKRAILERVLRLHNQELANSSSQFLALALFVRNLSFPFLLLALLMPLTTQYFSLTIIFLLSFLFLLTSISLLYRYQRFELYSHKSIAEGIIALSLEDFDFFKQ